MAGLYNSVQVAQNPYMSQYVGSIVPELSDYSKVVQQKYNTAADQDDSLTEALNNLQHLNLGPDEKYANELKSDYYNRLLERSNRGDFENMGRRTRHDAIQFSQAYQPLIQRQKDLSEIVKKVNSDANIADPQKKQQILQYIQDMNAGKPDPLTGDYERDGTGRIKLNGIQDWAYAKDVDINKKLADILSKKEAEIRQGGFVSDGQGGRISTVEKFRDPKVMAQLAREMMSTDPEIRAMIQRDTTLSTYKLSPEDVKANLAASDISPYESLKKRGLNDKQIAQQARAQGMTLDDAKISSVARQKAAYMRQGMSDSAAEKAILNDQVSQSLTEPHARALGSLLGFEQQTSEYHNDPMAVEKWKHATEQAEGNAFQVFTSGYQNPQTVDPGKITTEFSKLQANTHTLGSNVTSATLAAMKVAGLSTGDPVKDTALATEYTNNKLRMNQLKAAVGSKDIDLAGRLETLQNSYLSAKDNLGYSELQTKALEKASDIDLHAMYKQSGLAGKISQDEFEETLRNRDAKDRGLFSKAFNYLKHNYKNVTGNWESAPINKVISEYDKKIDEGAKKVKDGTVTMNTFDAYVPTGKGYLKQATDAIEQQAKLGTLRLREVGTDKDGSLTDLIGVDKSNINDHKENGDYGKLANTQVLINRNSVGGKPTVTIQMPDGTQKYATIEGGIDPAVMKELNHHLLKESLNNQTPSMAHSQAKNVLLSMGEQAMEGITLNDLKNTAPSTVPVKLNSDLRVIIKPGGPTGKRYKLISNVNDRQVKNSGSPDGYFNSAEDLGTALGRLNAE